MRAMESPGEVEAQPGIRIILIRLKRGEMNMTEVQMVQATLFSALAAIATAAGGVTAMKAKDKRHLILGLVGGIILGVVAFDLIPESLGGSQTEFLGLPLAMIVFVAGFLSLHTLEKVFEIHHGSAAHYHDHDHPVSSVSILAAAALVAHSFLDGLSIGVSVLAGGTVALSVVTAVVAHDFADGFNTYTVASLSGHRRTALGLLTLGALAPIAGAVTGTLLQVDPATSSLYLAYFAGFILYIATSHILPEAHANHASWGTLVSTIVGVLLVLLIL